MADKIIDISANVFEQASEFFNELTIKNARKLLSLSRISISYVKGDLDTYLILSGIIRDNRSHETKVVFKNRLKKEGKNPLTTNCDCHLWTEEGHCPHSASLFIFYLFQTNHNKSVELGDSDIPSVAMNSSLGVAPLQYGTIISGPQNLEGAPPNATYSSLQYLITNNKTVNFPVPEKFSGKINCNVECFETTPQESSVINTTMKFSVTKEDQSINEKVSIFESLYIFDWTTGVASHLPKSVKSFIQKIRHNSYSLSVNKILRLYENENISEFLSLSINKNKISKEDSVAPNFLAAISPSEKKNLIDLRLSIVDADEKKLNIPDFLKMFTFEGGKLSSFKKKKDAYSFIQMFSNALKMDDDNYKQELLNSNQKSQILELVNYTRDNESTYIYESLQNKLTIHENKTLLLVAQNLIDCFGDILFRFSKYDHEANELSFLLTSSNLFSGINIFYKNLSPYGLNIYYNKNEISKWRSKIRFERKQSTTKWFDLTLDVSEEDLEVIRNADLDSGIAKTSSGLVFLDQEQKDLIKFMKKYTKYEGKVNEEESEQDDQEEKRQKFFLPFNRARIFELFELKKLGIDGALTPEEVELCEKLASLKEMPQYELNEDLYNIMRPYQRTGYQWLRFLHENKLGACLADDMGLGKTLQSVAFIQSIYDQINHVLVVCPVTLLLNWEKEIQKFSNLDIHIYHGGSRTLPEGKKIILTSYGVMKKEVDTTFSNIDFDVLILDEVQHLKNIRSLGAYAARKVQAQFRICLTGTPVENDLAEFYNIMDLCVPGIWGDLQFVRTTSSSKSRLLARNTASPFILRRTKAQVLSDLPPKIENNVYLELSGDEKNRYNQSLVNIREKIQHSPSKKKYGEILKGLLSLRQNCLWQEHFTDDKKTKTAISSTKIEFLVETLEQILEEGHQAIVFSQFTTYLDIIQNILAEKHWKISRIDGSQSIKKRQEQVDVFQSGKSSVFLISLKAGGVGLNLTAASYVFVMDPWWNPAVEAQAIDRAHRIGQKNNLTVYRPIIKNSVEEKVLELQEMKKQLFYDLLPDNDDQYFTGKLSMKDFEHLFS